jgi:uncharacterized membrane protein YphA (DoxX/SURF4 family)
MQQINFLKNLAIMGGLLMLASLGPGPCSVDASATSPSAERAAGIPG